MLKRLLILLAIPVLALAQRANMPTFSTADPDAVFGETTELLGTAATRACSNSTLAVSRTDASNLSVGASSSATAPQEVRFGLKTRLIATALTLTISAGAAADVVYIWGQLYPNGTMTLVAQTGPTNTYVFTSGVLQTLPGPPVAQPAILLYTWTVTAGAFDSSGGTDNQTNQDCWVDQITLSNITGGAITVTITDNQTAVLSLLTAVSLAANSTTLLVFPGGLFFDGGMLINASGTAAIQAKWREGHVRRARLGTP